MNQQSKTDGLVLYEFLKKHLNNDFPKMYYSIMRDAGYSPNTYKKFIDPKEVNRIQKHHLCLISSLFGCTPQLFGYERNYFKSGFSKKEDTELYCYHELKEEDKDYKPFVINFFNVVNTYLLNVEKRLYISDYFVKVRGIEQKDGSDYFHARDQEYFLNQEKRLEETRFTYKRIAQIPLESDIHTFEAATEFVLEEMFPDTFGHICRCIKKHPDLFEFYILMKPYRLNTFYMVDDKVVLTEYLRFDRSGTPIPDTLFVNKANPDHKEEVGSMYFDSCLYEFNKMIHAAARDHCLVTDAIIFGSLKKLYRNIQKEIELAEQTIASKRSEMYQASIDFEQYDETQTTTLHEQEANLTELKKREKRVLVKVNILKTVFYEQA